MGNAAYITGSRADLRRITRALNAGPFVDPVFVEGKPMPRRTARMFERALTKKFTPPPSGSQAGDVAQQRIGHPLPHTAAAPAGAVVTLPASLNPHPTGEAGLSINFNNFEHGSHVGHE